MENNPEFKTIPLEQLLEVRKNGQFEHPLRHSDKEAKANSKDAKAKKKNKHAPKEMSAKIPVGRFREVIKTDPRSYRDPRFDSLSGRYNKELFQKSYQFIEGQKEKEIKILEKETKTAKRLKRKDADKLAQALEKMKNRVRSEQNQKKEEKLKRELKQKNMERVKQGLKPHYAKQSEFRELLNERKYKELKSEGKLGKFIEKKRKKNLSKINKLLKNKRPKYSEEQTETDYIRALDVFTSGMVQAFQIIEVYSSLRS